MNNSAADRRSPLGLFPGQPAPRLYDRVVEVLRTRHYSRRTEEAHLHWIRRFLLFHNGTHPRDLAGVGHASACHVLDRIEGVLLTRDEVQAILAQLDGAPRLARTLLYGSGLRLLEGLGLRVKDLDFGPGEITVREGKGRKDRVTMLPDALARKYPNAGRECGWQWVFPACSRHLDRGTGIRHRHHLHESVIQKAVHQAAHRAGLAKRVTTHASFICAPSIRGRLRHQNHPAPPGAQGHPDRDGLHTRIQSWRSGGPQPPRPSAQSRLHRERRDCPG